MHIAEIFMRYEFHTGNVIKCCKVGGDFRKNMQEYLGFACVQSIISLAGWEKFSIS